MSYALRGAQVVDGSGGPARRADVVVEALEAGIAWGFETFPEYLDTLERIPKRINVGAFIGHTPLRLYAMGDEAVERPATDDEVEAMRQMVLEAMAAGALGFATSR